MWFLLAGLRMWPTWCRLCSVSAVWLHGRDGLLSTQAGYLMKRAALQSRLDYRRLRKDIIFLFLATMLMVLLLSLIWEFYLEERFMSLLTEVQSETTFAKIEYVLTVTLFSALALIVPLLLLFSKEKKRLGSERVNHWLVRALEESQVNIVVTDLEGTIIYVSSNLCKLTGYSKEELLGENPRIFKSGLTPQSVYAELWQTITAGKEWRGELVNRSKSGAFFTENCRITPLKENGELTHFIAIKEDITERKKLENSLEQLSLTDSLTGLANRRGFDAKLIQEWNRAKRNKNDLSLLMVDIDFFKEFNDYYGHPAGDLCLQKVAGILSDSMRRPADSVARYGGEEFIIILPETEKDHALLLAGKIMENIYEAAIPHQNSSVADSLTLSIGIASTTPSLSQSGFFDLVNEVDVALYEAKRAGRNCIR